MTVLFAPPVPPQLTGGAGARREQAPALREKMACGALGRTQFAPTGAMMPCRTP